VDARRRLEILLTARDEASRTIRGASSSLGGLQAAMERAEAGSRNVLRTVTVATAALTGGLVAAATASFNQVRSVQQATVALNAYEEDASKVSKTLGELVDFARSDLGVLFQRQDLFAAAQGLKVMGAETENLSDFVQIMARSVGLGTASWDDLGRVIGRVGSTGRLTGIDFDNLTKSGFQLDDSIRNTNITWEELFEHLDEGIPADALAGQANTIDGQMVRLQSAFRDLGARILGVNDAVNGFNQGSIGQRFVELLDRIRETLRSEAFIEASQRFADAISRIVTFSFEAFERFINFVRDNTPLAAGMLLGALVPALVATSKGLIAMYAPLIPFILVGGAIGLLLNELSKGFGGWGEMLKFAGEEVAKVYNEVRRYLEPILENLWSFITVTLIPGIIDLAEAFWNHFGEAITGIWNEVKNLIGELMKFWEVNNSWLIPVIKIVAQFIGGLLYAAFWIFLEIIKSTVKQIRIMIGIFNALSSWIQANGNWIYLGLRAAFGPIFAAVDAARELSGLLKQSSTWASPVSLIRSVTNPGNNATGTNYWQGGATWVGERGPELVNLPRGSQVINNRESEAMSGSQVTINGNIMLGDRGAVDRFFERINRGQQLSQWGMAS
jgi:hypothetical protein